MQKGFATIFGLCMVLVFALVIKGVAAVEENHNYETTYFQAEQELQNAAVSGIYQAVAQVISGEVILPKMIIAGYRPDYQEPFFMEPKQSEIFGEITIEVWGERVDLKSYEVEYRNPKNLAKKKDDGKEAYIFFSRASADAKITPGKIYRRAFAYVLPNSDGTVDAKSTIHFLEMPTSTYTFRN